MKRSEILSNYQVNVLDNNSVFIQNRHFNFCYMYADKYLKEEYKGKYRYLGGLQCDFQQGTAEYKELENWLVEIAENVLESHHIK